MRNAATTAENKPACYSQYISDSSQACCTKEPHKNQDHVQGIIPTLDEVGVDLSCTVTINAPYTRIRRGLFPVAGNT